MGALKVTRKVSPGQPGALKEQYRYRDKLLAVRYLSDGQGRFVKTAEIIIYDRQDKGIK